MNSSDLHSITIDKLSLVGTVIHINIIGDTVEVWLAVPTSDGTQRIIRSIKCETHYQAQSVARLCNAVWC
jgi:hypothetical protein